LIELRVILKLTVKLRVILKLTVELTYKYEIT